MNVGGFGEVQSPKSGDLIKIRLRRDDGTWGVCYAIAVSATDFDGGVDIEMIVDPGGVRPE